MHRKSLSSGRNKDRTRETAEIEPSFRKAKEKQCEKYDVHRGQTYLTASHSKLRYFCYFFSSRVVWRPNSLPLPSRTPVACVAGVWRGRERDF